QRSKNRNDQCCRGNKEEVIKKQLPGHPLKVDIRKRRWMELQHPSPLSGCYYVAWTGSLHYLDNPLLAISLVPSRKSSSVPHLSTPLEVHAKPPFHPF